MIHPIEETLAETKARLFPEKRVKLEVWVDLDPIPGAFHTVESARNGVARILEGSVGHYNPTVSVAKQMLLRDAAALLREMLEIIPDNKEMHGRVCDLLERLED